MVSRYVNSLPSLYIYIYLILLSLNIISFYSLFFPGTRQHWVTERGEGRELGAASGGGGGWGIGFYYLLLGFESEWLREVLGSDLEVGNYGGGDQDIASNSTPW